MTVKRRPANIGSNLAYVKRVGAKAAGLRPALPRVREAFTSLREAFTRLRMELTQPWTGVAGLRLDFLLSSTDIQFLKAVLAPPFPLSTETGNDYRASPHRHSFHKVRHQQATRQIGTYRLCEN